MTSEFKCLEIVMFLAVKLRDLLSLLYIRAENSLVITCQREQCLCRPSVPLTGFCTLQAASKSCSPNQFKLKANVSKIQGVYS